MRVWVIGAVLVALTATSAFAQQQVKGYVRKDGTYVAPYVRSTPNNTTADNYSTKGNVNPYTGAVGTKKEEPATTTTTTPQSTYSAPKVTATCNDGSTSTSQNRSGTCSSHGGVESWR